ncbi:MAG: DNRLRE domain-containing protein, partial [bacterium]
PVRAVVEVEGIVSETIKVIQRFQLYGSSSILVQEISLEIPNYKPTNIKQALYYIFNLNNSSKPTMGIPFGAVPLIFQGGRARKIKFSRRSPGKSFKFGRKKKRPFGGEVYDLQKWINFDSGGHSIDLLSGRTQTRVYVKRGFAAVEIQGMINGHPDVLRFGIYSHASDWRKGNTPRRAWEFAHPMLGVATQEGKKGKALPEEACFLEVKSTNNTGNIIVSSLKRSFDGKGLALRFFETSDQDVTVKIKPVFKIPQAEVSRTNMVEQPFEPLNKTAGSYYVPIKGFGIETVKFYKQAVTDRKAPGRIKELSVTQTSSTGISLSWSASGDDGYEGKSSKYELRYSKRPINNHNWEQATLVKGLSPPRPAGEKEHFTVKGLKSSKTYYFAVKAIDESGNSSKLSKIISIVTESRDYIKPGRIVNLGVSKRASTSITLHWTASGDDGRRGKASRYDVLYSKESFDDTTWKRKAIAATGKIVPRKSGKPESFQVTGLQPTTKYYFSMVSYDEADNRSPLSNLTFSRTTSSITRAFQKGISPTVSYSGCSDTYLSKINEEELISIYGKETSLQTYSNNLSVILIRFDLSSIPTDAVVFKAILKLHAYDITYEDKGYLTCYRLKSDWNEEKGSGKTPDGKKSWKHGLEGSIDRQADYGLLPRGTVARAKTEDGKHWVKLDITPLVKDWVSKKQPNYGILLKGNCGGDCGMYFHSSDYEEDIKLRPRLEVSY